MKFGKSPAALQTENARLLARAEELERRLARQERATETIEADLQENHIPVPRAPLFGLGEPNKKLSRKELEAENARLEARIDTLARKLAKKKAENARLRDALYHDPLTGIHNLAFYNRMGETLYKHALNNHQPISFIMADLDRFKGINDTFGHDAGDEALRRFAAALKESVGEEGYALRMGGDEFVAILPNVDQGKARMIAGDLKDRIKAASFEWEGASHPIQLASSQGVVTLNDSKAKVVDTSVSSMEGLRKVADQVMYLAKTDAKSHQARNPIGRAHVSHT